MLLIPFQVCHPVCMADENGLGLGMLESWDTFGGKLKASANTRCPTWAQVPQQFHLFFCSKGTAMVLLIKVVFLVLSKCGPGMFLCSHSLCAGILKPLCTDVLSLLQKEMSIREQLVLASSHWEQRSSMSAEHSAEARAFGDLSLQLWPLQQISGFFLCYHILSPGVLKHRQVWKIRGCKTTKENAIKSH